MTIDFFIRVKNIFTEH